VPSPNSDFIAVAAGSDHSLGLKANGSIIAWGDNTYGQCTVPSPNSDFTAVAGGWRHSLGLKGGGSIVAWGLNNAGQCNVPSPNSDFIAVAAGTYHSLGLKANSSITAWGSNAWGQCIVPSPNSDFIAIDAGREHSLGLKAPNNPPGAPTITGLAKVKTNVKNDYVLNAIDPDEDNVSYYVDWGDGTNSSWTSPSASGVNVTVSHTWTTKGTYTISAKARDIYNAESDWTILEVTVPRIISINYLFQQFLQNHPHVFPILRHLLGV
jgi:hypothetical protein